MAYILELVTDVLQQPPQEQNDASVLLVTVLEVLADSFKHDEDGMLWQSPFGLQALKCM
jgi:hypothetical protein